MGHAEELRSLLANNDLFYSLSEEALDLLVSITVTRDVTAGETIFVAGEVGRQLYAVSTGQVKAVATAADGREMVLRLVDPGEVFGELALLDGGRRSATMIATRPTRLLSIERRDFIALLRRHPEVAIELLAVTAGRLRSTTEQVTDTNFLEIGPRLAKRIVDLAAQYGEEVPEGRLLRISQEDLGTLVAATRVSVNVQLKGWERDGLLQTGRGRLILLDPEGLARAAEVE